MEAPVTILMAVRDGAATLPDQLASLAAQQGADWRLIASDDGSSDDSRAVLAAFGADHPVEVRDGPGEGFAANFLSLIKAAPPGFAAFCDQDDIWFEQKLANAQAALEAVPEGTPVLYCSRSLVWDPVTDSRVPSPRYPHAPAFANALVENIAPGNTILLNPAALALAQAGAETARGIYAHDWWLYQLVTGAGGTVIWDAEATLLYRQHGAQSVGAGQVQVLANKRAAWAGAYAARLAAQWAALDRGRELLTEDARARLDLCRAAQSAGPLRRLRLLRRAGVWRQGALSRVSFWGAAALGKV